MPLPASYSRTKDFARQQCTRRIKRRVRYCRKRRVLSEPLVFAEFEREPLMTVVHQFFSDESGKHLTHPLTALCGVCAVESRLPLFNDEWRALLRSYDLHSLHMKQVS